MANKQGLIDHLLSKGKTSLESWSDLAKRFGFSNPDNARKCWSRYRREMVGYTPEDYTTDYIFTPPTTSTTSYIYTYPTTATKDDVLKEIRDTVSKIDSVEMAKRFLDFKESLRTEQPEYLLELAIFDLHIGKYAWKDETGEDYNLEIAAKRYKDAIKSLLSNVNISSIGRILLPIGNDLLHVDNNNNATTKGTPQDCSGRFSQMVKVAKDLLIETINDLSTIAQVDVVVISGNHDNQATLMIGEILEAYYHNSPLVTINNSPKPRKYYNYYSTTIQFTHGNEEKHQELGLIFATEQPHLWGLSKHRYCQLGHYHKTKRMSYISVDEHQGFQVMILPSLSGTDAWHQSKGYSSKKQAKAFLFHKDNGLTAEFTYNVQ